jgi:Spy/CpxP family protein refolding chaperone
MSKETRELRAAVREQLKAVRAQEREARRALRAQERTERKEQREVLRNEYCADRAARAATRKMIEIEAVMDAVVARVPHLAEKYAPLFQ